MSDAAVAAGAAEMTDPVQISGVPEEDKAYVVTAVAGGKVSVLEEDLLVVSTALVSMLVVEA